MRKVLLFLFAICITATAYAQDEPELSFAWKDVDLQKLRTADTVSWLSTEEKNLIFFTNLVRTNPQLFADTYLQMYIKKNDIRKDHWYNSLMKELKNAQPVEPLYPAQDLFMVAKAHAKDMGEAGKIGHRGTNGQFYADRTKQVRQEYREVRENIQYGYAEGLDVLCDLLIDEDFKNSVHRETILNPRLKYIAVSTHRHRKYDYNTVMEFGAEKISQQSAAAGSGVQVVERPEEAPATGN